MVAWRVAWNGSLGDCCVSWMMFRIRAWLVLEWGGWGWCCYRGRCRYLDAGAGEVGEGVGVLGASSSSSCSSVAVALWLLVSSGQVGLRCTDVSLLGDLSIFVDDAKISNSFSSSSSSSSVSICRPFHFALTFDVDIFFTHARSARIALRMESRFTP